MPLFASGNGTYRCLDARLYDAETLTVVLQGQEEERVLAQLPLSAALRSEEEFAWDTTLRCSGVWRWCSGVWRCVVVCGCQALDLCRMTLMVIWYYIT